MSPDCLEGLSDHTIQSILNGGNNMYKRSTTMTSTSSQSYPAPDDFGADDISLIKDYYENIEYNEVNTVHTVLCNIEGPRHELEIRGWFNSIGSGEVYIMGEGFNILGFTNLETATAFNEYVNTEEWKNINPEKVWLDSDDMNNHVVSGNPVTLVGNIKVDIGKTLTESVSNLWLYLFSVCQKPFYYFDGKLWFQEKEDLLVADLYLADTKENEFESPNGYIANKIKNIDVTEIIKQLEKHNQHINPNDGWFLDPCTQPMIRWNTSSRHVTNENNHIMLDASREMKRTALLNVDTKIS